MKRLIYIIAIFLMFGVWLSGCRSAQPSVKTDTEIKGAETKDEVKSNKDSMSLVLEKKINKVYERVDNLNIDITQLKTNYSAPDSTGKQHPTSTTETRAKVNSNTTEKAVTYEKVLLQLDEVKSSLDTIKSTLDYLIKQNIRTKPSLTWWKIPFIWAIRIICIVGIVALAIWVSKRINWIRLFK